MDMRLSFFVVACASLLAACAGVSGMSKTEVEALPDTRLCRMMRTTPVGFLPLEVERRQLDCATQQLAILHELYKEQEGLPFSIEIPGEYLRKDECGETALGAVVMPRVTVTSGSRLGGWIQTESKNTDHRFHQHVVNRRSEHRYVLAEYKNESTGKSGTKLVRLAPGESQLVRFGTFSNERFRVSIIGCRTFAP